MCVCVEGGRPSWGIGELQIKHHNSSGTVNAIHRLLRVRGCHLVHCGMRVPIQCVLFRCNGTSVTCPVASSSAM